MNASPSTSPILDREQFIGKVGDMLSGEIDDAEARQLEILICNNLQIRQWYLDFICDACILRTQPHGLTEHDGVLPLGTCGAERVPTPPPSPPAVPTLSLLNTAYHGTVGFFSQEIPFACLVTTIIMGVAGVIGLNITKEHYTQLPWQPVASADRSYAVPESDTADKANAAVKEEKMGWVGQITGKIDCVWADDSTAPVWHKIKINDKFDLRSGLMEITYYTGAKVILQGPCSYEVDSADGGFLSIGKLTARVENKRGEGRGESAKLQAAKTQDPSPKTESRNPKIPKSQNPSSLATSHSPLATASSPQPPAPSPLFTVRTPTAVVTDLGTEFGVEVEKSGRCLAQVFRGAVQFQSLLADGTPGNAVQLGENQSAAVEDRGGQARLVPLERAAAFVRTVRRPGIPAESSLLKGLLAYWSFDQTEGQEIPNEAAKTAGLFEGTLGADDQPGDDDPRRCRGRVNAALRFDGADDFANLPVPSAPKPTSAITVSYWVNPANLYGPVQCPITKQGAANYANFAIGNTEGVPTFYHGFFIDDHWRNVPLTYGLGWQHAVVAWRSGEPLRAWLNGGQPDGKPTAEARQAWTGTLRWDAEPINVGRNIMRNDPRYFEGDIDELALWNRVLTQEEIQQLYNKGQGLSLIAAEADAPAPQTNKAKK